MDRTSGLPSFNHCLSVATREGTYECKDGVWRKLEEYLREDHPNWLPFVHDPAAGNKDVQHLRAAWVHCREALLEYYKPMADHCPKEWVEAHQGEGQPLTKSDHHDRPGVYRHASMHGEVHPRYRHASMRE